MILQITENYLIDEMNQKHDEIVIEGPHILSLQPDGNISIVKCRSNFKQIPMSLHEIIEIVEHQSSKTEFYGIYYKPFLESKEIECKICSPGKYQVNSERFDRVVTAEPFSVMKSLITPDYVLTRYYYQKEFFYEVEYDVTIRNNVLSYEYLYSLRPLQSLKFRLLLLKDSERSVVVSSKSPIKVWERIMEIYNSNEKDKLIEKIKPMIEQGD